MIITCPLCATRYEANEEAFEPDGRKVRCTSCAHTWFQWAEGAEPQAPEEDTVAGEATEAEAAPEIADEFPDPVAGLEPSVDIESEAKRLAHASRRATAGYAANRAMRTRKVRGWMMLAASVALFTSGSYYFREQIVKTFPAAAQLYAEAGIIVNTRGLALRNVRYFQDFEDGIPVMAIEGEVVNISGVDKMPPRLRFGLLNDKDQEIYHWMMVVHRTAMKPDATVPFKTRLASPPAAARNIQVRFAAASR